MNYKNIREIINTNKHFIWIFNIGVEGIWNNSYGIKDKNSVKIVNEIEDINLLLTSKDDIIIMRNAPSPLFLEYLTNLGFEIPKILTVSNNDENKFISELILEDIELLNNLKKYKDYLLFPYGISKYEEEISSYTGIKIVSGNSEAAKLINDKILSRQVALNLNLNVIDGKICTFDEIESFVTSLLSKYNKVIIKSAFGASGKGLYIVSNLVELKRILLVIKRFHKNESAFIVEGWVDDKTDYNYQIYVDDNGPKIFSIKKQILNETTYIGSSFQIGDNEKKEIEETGIKIANYVHDKYHYNGFLGIDCLKSKTKLIPIIEINGRLTLSTYLSFINHVFPNKCFFSFYKNVINFSFNDVIALLRKSNIDYNSDRGTGVICYVEGTLLENGRLFLLIIANSEEEIEDYKRKLEKIFNFEV